MCTKRIDLWMIILSAIIIAIFTANFVIHSSPGSCAETDNCNWAEKTKAAVDKLITENSNQPNTYTVFDWDNTCIYSDVEENLFVFQIENLEFRLTPEQFKYAFTHFADLDTKKNNIIPNDSFLGSFTNTDGKLVDIEMLVEDCYNDYQYLYDNFGKLNKSTKANISLEEIKKSEQFKDFRAKMFFTYSALYESFPSNISYTWVIYLSATGFTSDEFKTVVEKSVDWGINSPIENKYFDSPESLPGKAGIISNTLLSNPFRSGLRIIPEMNDLFDKLRNGNIEIYICSASHQEVVEVFAENPKYGYNLPQNHVLGMRLKKDKDGRFISEYDFSNKYTVNGGEGKTINICNVLVEKYKSNPILIAGDSDGDYPMITQFSGLDGISRINNYKPLQLALIMNRLKKGKIGALCELAVKQIDKDFDSETVLVLQGRDENTGKWIPSERTLKFGLLSESNWKLLP